MNIRLFEFTIALQYSITNEERIGIMKKHFVLWIGSFAAIACIGLIFLFTSVYSVQKEGAAALQAVAAHTSLAPTIAMTESNTYFITDGKNNWKVVMQKVNGNWKAEDLESINQIPNNGSDDASF